MPIEHIVVLMLENRSFDNVLGALYGSGGPPYTDAPPGQVNLDGIPPGATNPGPTGPVPAHNQQTPTSLGQLIGSGPPYSPTTIPLVDPGEYFKDMAQQLIGLRSVPRSPPWGSYSPDSPDATRGYVLNYSQLSGVTQKRPPEVNYPDVMNYFTPAQLPVSAFLARNYGVSDAWFGSVPSQTYVNRSFALAGAPAVYDGYSFVDDVQYFGATGGLCAPPLVPIQDMPTLLRQLDETLGRSGAPGPFWKVYFHDYSITWDTLPYVRNTVARGEGLNVGTYDDSDWHGQTPTQLISPTAGAYPVASSFVEDLRNDALPPFSWIEPRYFNNWAPGALPPNSNHPGYAPKPFCGGSDVPRDAATGEVFLMELYNLLQASPAWDSTLLIVTYDEHGGVWDHVPPPPATPPGGSVPPANNLWDPAAANFNYTVFGGRVPTLVVSPLVPPGSLLRAPTAGMPFDHTSIIKSVRDVFLGATAPALTDRDAAAPSLLHHLASTPVNTTGPFAGTVVAGPSSLYFQTLLHGATAQTLFASAGPGFPLSVSPQQPSGESWLSASTTGAAGMVTVTVDPDGAHGPGSYFGQVNISTNGASAVVPVQLDVTF